MEQILRAEDFHNEIDMQSEVNKPREFVDWIA